MYLKCKHDGDGSSSSSSAEGSKSTGHVRELFEPVGRRAAKQHRAQLREEGGKGWVVGDVASERVEQADGAVVVQVPYQQQEAVDGVDGAVSWRSGIRPRTMRPVSRLRKLA